MLRQFTNITAALIIATLPCQVMADKKHRPKLSCKEHKLTLEVWSHNPIATSFTSFECPDEKRAQCKVVYHNGDAYPLKSRPGYVSKTVDLGSEVKRVTVHLYATGQVADKHGKLKEFDVGKVKTRCKK